ncbi:AAA domain-containing protein [Fusarium falciforme]|uniref:AAA domain-containing protein n=1 Tax=Fusarium falciforme TaxID=195108 RepID=UPI002300C645|nr:AAA domain-containing protein [Fusarium falciforme]WAO90822.1 AAA domain-containing protein [Fusarium falciforme]
MESLLEEVHKAQEQHNTTKSSRHPFTKEAALMWTKAVNKINTFSKVIDVLVSSHPEYSALVWGSIKFLFLVTLSHQELASKISDAFCAISEALPEVDFLAIELYPVPHMQTTLATIYTHIIDFCARALKWYSKTTGNFIGKTLAAIKDPWALEFHDVVCQIQRTTARIREQAAVAHQAETRYVSSVISQVQQEVVKLQKEKELSVSPHGVLPGSATSPPPSQPSLLGTAPLVIKKIAKYFLSVRLNPENALVPGTTWRGRRRKRGNPVPDQLLASSAIFRLQIENEMLKEELKAIMTAQLASPEQAICEASESAQGPNLAKFVTFHQVSCHDSGTQTSYLDPPRLFRGGTENDHFRGTHEVGHKETYLESHPEVFFAVVRHYECDGHLIRSILTKEGQPGPRGRVLVQDHYPKEPEAKEIMIGPVAQAGLKAIIEAFPHRFPGFDNSPGFLKTETPFMVDLRFRRLPKPYPLFYLYGKTLIESLGEVDLDDLTRESLWLLCQWMEDNFRKEWDEADALFARGKVNRKHFMTLFRPGELLVRQDPNEGRPLSGAIVPWFPSNTDRAGVIQLRWEFNGILRHTSSVLGLPPGYGSLYDSDDRLLDITSLECYPLRFASVDIKEKLIARGQRFWACRRRKLVCYDEHGADSVFQAEGRFMIDYAMFKRLHPTNSIFEGHSDYTWANDQFMGIEEPPEDFLYCLPPKIHGFDFTTKAWKTLQVDDITDVTWNKRAFSQVVVPPETKELILAAVSAHGERKSMDLDIVQRKGQGLLVLLHGGPGTGKTLTAESIAEEQEMPLYRVTCGNIGTEPAEVERYFDGVLEIGRAWDCVVLLDEADVFLEERSFSDQKRNAIISIFLRILEYYDGIIILTTNRIGSFDEAFKSRIQLALGYPALGEEDRFKIWSNFIQMLHHTKVRVDMEDLQMNLPKLARVEVNGREIRNIITVARDLAKFRKETLQYQHMRDALRSSQKFSEYLNQVKGVSDDDWARADKLR